MSYLFEYTSAKSAAVLPPKPARKPPVGFTMAELQADARKCNARLNRSIGDSPSQKNFGYQGNHARMKAAQERDIAMGKVILALLQSGPMSRSQIATALHASDDITKRVLHRMRDEGLIKAEGHHRFLWSAA